MGDLTEFQLHKQAAEYFRTVLAPEVLWWHTANNPKSAKHGAWLKDMGLLAGVPDFLLMWRGNGGIMVMAIEMKTPRGTLSPAQKDFQTRLYNCLGLYFRCTSLTEINDALRINGVPTRGRIAA